MNTQPAVGDLLRVVGEAASVAALVAAPAAATVATAKVAGRKGLLKIAAVASIAMKARISAAACNRMANDLVKCLLNCQGRRPKWAQLPFGASQQPFLCPFLLNGFLFSCLKLLGPWISPLMTNAGAWAERKDKEIVAQSMVSLIETDKSNYNIKPNNKIDYQPKGR